MEGSSGRARRMERSGGVLPGSVWTRALEQQRSRTAKTHLSPQAAERCVRVRFGVENFLRVHERSMLAKV